MLSFFSRYKYNQKSNLYNSYDTNLQKYIRKIKADLREKNNILVKPLQTDIILHNHGNNNYIFIPIVAFICFLAGYNLSKM